MILCNSCAHKLRNQLPIPKFVSEQDRFIEGTGIDRILTIEKFRYDPTDLSKGSKYRIIVICQNCNKIREISMCAYRNLCILCSRKRGENHSMFRIHRYGEDSPNYGNHHSNESKEKIRKSKIGKQLGKDNPFYNKKHSEKSKELIKTTLIRHHYIYDYNDLSKYTTLMTRSKHTSLHNNMRKSNIKIPHINEVK